MFGNDDSYGDGGYWFLAPVGTMPPGYGATLGPPVTQKVNANSWREAGKAFANKPPATLVAYVPGQRSSGLKFQAVPTKQVNGVWYWVMVDPNGQRSDIGAVRSTMTVQARITAAAAGWSQKSQVASGGMVSVQKPFSNQLQKSPFSQQPRLKPTFQTAQAATPGAVTGTTAIGSSTACTSIDRTSSEGIVQMTSVDSSGYSTGDSAGSSSGGSSDLPVQQAAMSLGSWDTKKVAVAAAGLAALAGIGYLIYNYSGWDFTSGPDLPVV